MTTHCTLAACPGRDALRRADGLDDHQEARARLRRDHRRSRERHVAERLTPPLPPTPTPTPTPNPNPNLNPNQASRWASACRRRRRRRRARRRRPRRGRLPRRRRSSRRRRRRGPPNPYPGPGPNSALTLTRDAAGEGRAGAGGGRGARQVLRRRTLGRLRAWVFLHGPSCNHPRTVFKCWCPRDLDSSV